MTIQDLETAVSNLPLGQLQQFRTWFEEFDAEKWDQEFETDVHSGKLDAMAQQALKEFSEGKCTRF